MPHTFLVVAVKQSFKSVYIYGSYCRRKLQNRFFGPICKCPFHSSVFHVINKQCLFADAEGIYLFTSGVPDQPAEVCNSYLEEATAGRPTKLHVTLFSIDETDVVKPDAAGDEANMLPCRYASISQTAQVLRDMAHSTAGGRFHWVRETGKLLYVLSHPVDEVP